MAKRLGEAAAVASEESIRLRESDFREVDPLQRGGLGLGKPCEAENAAQLDLRARGEVLEQDDQETPLGEVYEPAIQLVVVDAFVD